MCKDPALPVSTSAQGMQGVPTALASLSGEVMSPNGWQQLLEPQWSLEVTCLSCWVEGFPVGPECVPSLGSAPGCPGPSTHPLAGQVLLSVPARSISSVRRGSTRSSAEAPETLLLTPQHSTVPKGLAAPQIS